MVGDGSPSSLSVVREISRCDSRLSGLASQMTIAVMTSKSGHVYQQQVPSTGYNVNTAPDELLSWLTMHRDAAYRSPEK